MALAAVFAAAVLEALAVIGTVIPGSTIVFAGGVLIGLHALNPWTTATLAVAGAVLGDGISYWLGCHYRKKIRILWPMRRYPALFDRGQAYFENNGGKSVFLGRFLGPLRAIVPVIAGMSNMPPTRFYAMNVLSAFVWSAAHLIPGVLFGASLQLAGAVSSRLALLLVALALLLWGTGVLVRAAIRLGRPRVAGLRDRLVERARGRQARGRQEWVARLVLSLFDSARPESQALLSAAVVLAGATWLFLGILEDVVSSDPLIELDRTIYALLQGMRTDWADSFMVFVTGLGGAAGTAAVVLAVAALFAIKRYWRSLGYWLAAAGFAEVLVWALKYGVGRSRPSAIYSGVEQFSFPSGHAVLAITVYGFLAFLMARGKSAGGKTAIALLAASAIVLVAFSRLYLGVHWFSDVMASLGLGLAWVALLGIAYTHHVRNERVSAWALLLLVSAPLALVGGSYLRTHHDADLAKYAYRPKFETLTLADWKAGRWRELPGARSELAGEAQEPFSVQWAGKREQISAALAFAGWDAAAPWTPKSALLWLLPAARIEALPVLPKFDRGARPKLTFVKILSARERLVIRLWTLRDVIESGSGGQPRPLWNGMLTLEELRRPAAMITLAATRPDFASPARILEQDLRKQPLSAARRERNGAPVLLLW